MAVAVAISFAPFGAASAVAQSQGVRICDEQGCSVRSPDYVPPDREEAERAVREDVDIYQGEPMGELLAAYDHGDRVAAYKLGMIAEYGIAGRKANEAQAASYYAFAAERGHVWAEYRLASFLSSGPASRRNSSRAMELFFKAAKAGQPQSANNIGLEYLKGRGLPKDIHQALYWLDIAAKGGVPEAEYNLGVIYIRGEADVQDLYQGLKWTKLAAANGQLGAKKILGRIYMTGMDNVRPNLGEAKHMLEPVAAAGDKEARGWLAEINQAEEQNREQARETQKQNTEIFKFLGGVALATMLAPPPTYIITQ